MNIHIRPETAEDIAGIRDIVAAAFAAVPYSDKTEPLIVEALRRSGVLAVSLVAETGGTLAGHVAVSPVSVADGSRGWYGLGPISVLPEVQRKGIGTQLMERALAGLRGMGASGCVLLGEPGFYGRFGFKPVPGLVFPGASAGYFQASVFRGATPKGEVKYHESFYGLL